jgi:hypothetical protein
MNVQKGSPLSGLMDSLAYRLTSEAVIVVRTEQKVSLLKQYGELRKIETRRWGTMTLTILKKTNK